MAKPSKTSAPAFLSKLPLWQRWPIVPLAAIGGDLVIKTVWEVVSSMAGVPIFPNNMLVRYIAAPLTFVVCGTSIAPDYRDQTFILLCVARILIAGFTIYMAFQYNIYDDPWNIRYLATYGPKWWVVGTNIACIVLLGVWLRHRLRKL